MNAIAKAQRRARLTAISNMRAAFADRNYPRLRRAIAAELKRHVEKIAGTAALGGKLQITRELERSWAAALVKVIKPHVYGMVAHSWEISGEDAKRVGSKQSTRETAAKIEVEGIDIGRAPENFLVKGDFPSINKWIQSTAVSAAETSSSRLQNIFTRAFEFYDEEKQQGLTPREIAAQLFAQGVAQTEARAEMLAHTGTMWAYNEGAMQRYGVEGVGVVEWLTANDDLRCPFCAEMNGKRIETGDAFFGAGDSLVIPEVGSMKIPTGARGFDIRHPPLHPNCRCALVPILSEDEA